MKHSMVFAMIMALVLTGFTSGTSFAIVSGQCSQCHTMHNSQNNDKEAWGDDGDRTTTTAGPCASLTKSSCVGCHTTLGADPRDKDGFPFVMFTKDPTDSNYLAGGFFPQSDADGHKGKGHNLTSKEVPAGIPLATFKYSGETNGLSCAGMNGCHGQEQENVTDDTRSIAGGHHGTDTVMGYRMLMVGTSKVDGVGAGDYEEALNDGTGKKEHNLYSAGTGGNATISQLCAKCHGTFHESDAAKDWVRHPTDTILIAGMNIFDNFAASYDSEDWKNNPVGTPSPTKEKEITGATAYVTCLSCHRAHGSEFPDALRWKYEDQKAGQSKDTTKNVGCLGCHTAQKLQQ